MKRLCSILLLCVGAHYASSQVAVKANEQYQTHEGREAVAKGLAAPGRNDTQRPRELVESMGLRGGQTVVDVGTGVGYMLPFLSQAVGPTGHVIAEDIAQDFIDKARTRALGLNLKNVSFVLGTATDPQLPADRADAILILDVYHHFDYPDTMLGHLRDALVSDGRVFIVDYYKSPEAMPNSRALEHIRLDADGVIKEVEAAGFKLISRFEHNPKSQYVAVFQKK